MKTSLGLLVGIAVAAAMTLSEDLPIETSTLFAGSGRCESCHSAAVDVGGAMRAADGSDISPVTLWRSSVMANAAKDPVWQAKVAAEVSVHPSLQVVIEDKCTACHTPMARTEAVYGGATAYSIAEAVADPLAMDGVSCTLCHQVQASNLGSGDSFSGGYIVDDSRVIFGPYDDVLSTVMEASVNYTAAEGLHLTGSELCATCHTLFTPTIDNAGQIVGQIPEQTPYFEWLNSAYPDRGIECQTCHMPEDPDPTAISTVPPSGLAERSPFSKHYFVGGNTTLLQMLRQEGESIGVAADVDLIDSTLARTRRQLRRESAELTATYAWPYPDTLEVTLTVTNRAGHKLPTGFPSRRMWLNVSLSDGGPSPVFESGRWNPEIGEIDHLDEPYEPHYDVVKDERQVVVYQSLMADVDGGLTWTLLRGATYLKDNRLPPEGFTTLGTAYDSTKITGKASVDPNFNRLDGIEGSGSDRVTYRIGGLSRSAGYTLTARLLYQSLSKGFVDDLARYPGEEVARFNDYYSRVDKTPVTMDSLLMAISATGIEQVSPRASLDISLYPNPATDGVTFRTEGAGGRVTVAVFDLLGKRVAELSGVGATGESLLLRWDTAGHPDGVYVYRVTAGRLSASAKVLLIH